jgi:DNA repair protein SbcD/Mre11
MHASKLLQERAARLEVSGKLVAVRVMGELAGGRTTEVDVQAAKRGMESRGAIHVYVNKHGLTSKEQTQAKVLGEDPATIERSLFEENLAKLKLSNRELAGESGMERARELLRLLRQGPKAMESKKDYTKRLLDAGAQALLARELLEEAVE